MQSQPIATPQVRPLDERELAARRAIIVALRAAKPVESCPDPSPATSGAGAAPTGEAPAAAAAEPKPMESAPGAAEDADASAGMEENGAVGGGSGDGGGGERPVSAAVKVEAAVQRLPAQDLAAGQGLDIGEGSSDEDTDDEAFAARHHPEETAEYVRNRVHKGARRSVP